MAQSSGRATKKARSKQPPQPRNSVQPLALIALSIVAFLAFLALPRVRANSVMLSTFIGTAAALIIATFALKWWTRRQGRTLFYEASAKPVHYVQLLMHSSIYVYWGWYWRAVYHFFPLIIAQLAFAYALDMIVCWFRRDKWILGFGPFPIILSTNLFLWFKDEYFYLQFALIAAGVLGKEFIKWRRDGRLTHIFNPSAFSLSVFSLGMILTHSTGISWGQAIASTQQRPPYIYLEIFLLGMVVQSLFHVTLVTLSSAVALYALNIAFTHHTGSYMFIDSNIPAAVFLGMHLLVTDPATSPRTNFGKLLFGVAYGGAVFGLFWWFDAISTPTFYDKLLPVPFLNLCVPLIDRACRALEQRIPRLDLGAVWGVRRANFAHMGVWVALFAVMASTNFVGSTHPGMNISFWQQACNQGRYNACHTLVNVTDYSCSDEVASSCLLHGQMLMEGRVVARDTAKGLSYLLHACSLGERDGCATVVKEVQSGNATGLQQACDKNDAEACASLGLIYAHGVGVMRDGALARTLYEKGCSRGSSQACGLAGESYAFDAAAGLDTSRAIGQFELACRRDYAPSCFNAGMMYRRGMGVKANETKAEDRFRAACDLGFARACEIDDETRSSGLGE